MEQIVRDVKLRQVARQVLPLAIPSPFIAITLLLVISFSIAVVVVNTSAKRLDEASLPDPFATFSDVFPGQRLATRKLEAQGFSCYFDTQPSPADITERCWRDLQIGAFSQISVTIWDGMVHSFNLSPYEHSLTIGDLALLWGRPQVNLNGTSVRVSWPDHRITALGKSQNGRFTYFVPISQIWFEEKDDWDDLTSPPHPALRPPDA